MAEADNKTKQSEPLAEMRARKIRAAGFSIGSNLLLVVVKLIVGFWSGSVSVLSEALHSAGDLAASGIAFFSVRASDTPPDREHPYGHGKIESLSGLAEALLIFVAAIYIIAEAVLHWRAGEGGRPAHLDAGLGVMGFSALLNIVLSTYLHRTARATDSLALEADAQHLRTDVITSLGVLVGLALVRLTGYAWFDPLTALLVALLILHTAYRLTREALMPLLDTRLPAEEEAAIRNVLNTEARVLSYHKLRTRKSGSQRHADVHVLIDDNSTLLQAHDLTEELEDRIREALPAIHVNIHTEPYHAEIRHQQEAHGVALPTPSDDRMPPAPANGVEAGRPRDKEMPSESRETPPKAESPAEPSPLSPDQRIGRP